MKNEMHLFKSPSDYPYGQYTGELVDDQPNGNGTCIWPRGRKYKGEFRNGKFHGWGTYTWPNARKYVGEWKDGLMEGRGTIVLANGAFYDGGWRVGRRDGFGTEISIDESKYVGEWKTGKRAGRGSQVEANGDEYIGEWDDGRRFGRGVFRRQDGSQYIGEIIDEPNGIGSMVDSEGTHFSGSFADGRQDGRVVAKFASGLVYDGDWKDAQMHGHGRWASSAVPDTEIEYVGGWRKGKMHGQGTMSNTFANGQGCVYVGDWERGWMHGEGSVEFTLEAGTTHQYVGQWQDEKRHGSGTYTITVADGEQTVYDGQWCEGQFVDVTEAKVGNASQETTVGSGLVIPTDPSFYGKKRPLRFPRIGSEYKKLSNVDRVGWHVVQIVDADPAFVFSIGLYHSFGHPEIMIAGLPIRIGADLINRIGRRIEKGEIFSDSDVVDGIADTYPMGFRKMSEEFYGEYLGSAIWFYESSDFPVLQCVWPDRESRLPGEDQCDKWCAKLQRLRIEETVVDQ